MSINNEGIPSPNSIEAQALAELEKEGLTVEGKQPEPTADSKKETEPKKEEEKKPEPVKKEEGKTDRTPSMVEAWKLKVAEDQKEAALAAKAELEARLEEMSKQKTPITKEQEQDIADEIKAIAEGSNVDPEFLNKFASTILKKAESKYKPSIEIEKTLNELKNKQELEAELNLYSQEFEKDVLPLITDLSLSGEQLSELKNNLRDLAFSETYAKVPLKEIFQIKQSTFNLPVHKKSSEGKGVKARANEVVDLDNMDEDSFKRLPDDAILAFESKNRGSWATRK